MYTKRLEMTDHLANELHVCEQRDALHKRYIAGARDLGTPEQKMKRCVPMPARPLHASEERGALGKRCIAGTRGL